MSERFTIERCQENFNRAVRRALNIRLEGKDNNNQSYPMQLGWWSSLYREQYHGGM